VASAGTTHRSGASRQTPSAARTGCGCPQPTQRSRSSTGRRSRPQRRPWQGSQPADGGGHGPFAGRGSWRGRRAAAALQLVAAGRRGRVGSGRLGSRMLGR
jgi:hypothetical protein